MTGSRFSLEVYPEIPERLKRLNELANDLLYSWDSEVRSLFVRLDPVLWQSCGHNPKVFLRRISQQTLEEAVEDRVYLQDYNRVLSAYDTYLNEENRSEIEQYLDPKKDLIAYFCAEFGFHESFPIYSGGLGILAGDHCKAASDLGLPFVAVGLLYRQGYFHQTIDGQGDQIAHYFTTDSKDLPIEPARDKDNNEIHVHVNFHKRRIGLKVWMARAGHIKLLLLDSDLPTNSEADRAITQQLYGGDINTRMQQEIILGIGGVRALRATGLAPTIWHINEGHSAFQILERCREKVAEGLDFDSALELIAAGTVYTTHTPVPAGHDIFEHHLISSYFTEFNRELGIKEQRFLELGAFPSNPHGFNMTTFALRGSRFHNGVSQIHGGVASNMEGYVWPQIPADENPIDYVTNGVHVPTFLAHQWVNLFDMHFGGGWRNELLNEEYWEGVDDIPDHSYWSTRQSLKTRLFDITYERVVQQQQRNGCSPSQIDRLTQLLGSYEPDVLTIGFARRFATYKRATLLFSDPERLMRLVNNPEKPVVFIFAGKAHPHDVPGQQLLKVINDYSRSPEFEGKIILLEGYDINLARILVTSVDVWLNTPEFPLEASGTSGEKAGINGVINLSVLDGWWGEGYNGENGWGIAPHGPQFDNDFRDREEANELMDILEQQVVPLYYQRNGHGYSEEWVKKCKASMKSLIPRFNAQRMVMDYVKNFYAKANKQSALLHNQDSKPAIELAQWKKKVAEAWPMVTIRRTDRAPESLKWGEKFSIEIAASIGTLNPEDVIIECLLGTEEINDEFICHKHYKLKPKGSNDAGETLFSLELFSNLPGLQYYKIRIYPYHRLLSRRFETGCMLWL